jgi:hypothetical protein
MTGYQLVHDVAEEIRQLRREIELLNNRNALLERERDLARREVEWLRDEDLGGDPFWRED